MARLCLADNIISRIPEHAEWVEARAILVGIERAQIQMLNGGKRIWSSTAAIACPPALLDLPKAKNKHPSCPL